MIRVEEKLTGREKKLFTLERERARIRVESHLFFFYTLSLHTLHYFASIEIVSIYNFTSRDNRKEVEGGREGRRKAS